MPSLMSGVRGGIEGRHDADRRLAFLHEALRGDVSASVIEQEVRSAVTHQAITLVVNNACNLACKHCYLQVEKLHGNQLNLEEYARLFDSALDQEPDLICLSGKEVFLGNKGAELLSMLSEARTKRKAHTRIGVITNGTLIHNHRDVILNSGLDYLDISVDGIEEDHDANRGQGAFAMMLPNLKWAARELGNRLFVNMTLQQRNYRQFPKAIEQLNRFGVRTVGCSFYHPLPYTDSSLALSDDDYESIFARLGDLGRIPLRNPLTVLMEVDLLSFPGMLAFLRSNWFSPEEVSVDDHGEFFCETTLANGLRLQIRFSPFPLLIFKSVRITPEGLYLAAEDTINTRNYLERSLGNLRDFDFDLTRLHVHASQSERLTVIMNRYVEEELPRLQEAYAASLWTASAGVHSEALALV